MNARKHFWYDAVVGAAIGIDANYIFTSRYNVSVTPYVTDDIKGGGVNVNYALA